MEMPKPLTKEDRDMLKEIYKSPILQRHLRIIGCNAIKDSAYTQLTSEMPEEEYARKQIHFKAIIQTIEALLETAETVVLSTIVETPVNKDTQL